MSTKCLAHVCLKTPDLKRTHDFYCGALEMRKVFDFTRDGVVIGFYLDAGSGTFMEVFHSNETAAPDAGRMLHHFCLQTSAIELLRQRVIDAGFASGEI